MAEAVRALDDARGLYLNTLRGLRQPIPPEPETYTTVVWTNGCGSARSVAHAAILPTTELTARQCTAATAHTRGCKLLGCRPPGREFLYDQVRLDVPRRGF